MLCAYTGPLWAKQVGITQRLEAIRARIGGRLGIYALDTESGKHIGFDDTSRYAMASTFKLMLAAAVLTAVDKGTLALEQKVAITAADVLPHAPVTSKYVAAGSITIRELCAAAVEESDNAAANLLLARIGGPAGLTDFMRSLGDKVTRLDRTELTLNSNLPGDPRDTTTPRAMVLSMEKVLTKPTLSDASRDLLIDWLVRATPGLKRIRSGLPQDWKVGDKTGTGQTGAVNDLAIAWPPQRRPILMAIYMSESKLPTEQLAAAHAEIGSLLAQHFIRATMP
jgi:beta-lactamase class A